MKTIKVNKISVSQYNRLTALGYKVVLTTTTEAPSIFKHYVYNKPVKPATVIVNKNKVIF